MGILFWITTIGAVAIVCYFIGELIIKRNERKMKQNPYKEAMKIKEYEKRMKKLKTQDDDYTGDYASKLYDYDDDYSMMTYY